MPEDPVFLVSEIWLKPESFERFKAYRQKTMDILIKHRAEYVYHGHPFEWFRNPEGDGHPTGIEVFHFHNEEDARKALVELNESTLKKEETELFLKVRSYLSRYAISPRRREGDG
jgi:uncharacterized protein (DUF1330 family)